MIGPLLTDTVFEVFDRCRRAGGGTVDVSLDLDRTTTQVTVTGDLWMWQARSFPFPARWRDRTIYHWSGTAFEPVQRFSSGLLKLVPTAWGAPTFEIDGIKMLPTAKVSPLADAERKVALVKPARGRVLDTCAGLGYFAAAALRAGAREIWSYEKNPDVLWLRSLNPWSPDSAWSTLDHAALRLTTGDVVREITAIESGAVDAVLHDPPRFGIAGELYAQDFYDELARVLRPGGMLFHYTGTPNRLTSGRDVPREVATRLARSGFRTELNGDGVLAMRERVVRRPQIGR